MLTPARRCQCSGPSGTMAAGLAGSGFCVLLHILLFSLLALLSRTRLRCEQNTDSCLEWPHTWPLAWRNPGRCSGQRLRMGPF